MNALNNITHIALIIAIIVFVIVTTVGFIRSFRKKNDTSLGRRIWNYIKEVMDALWGLG